MPFVPTGFPVLDRMIAGNGDCKGLPRGGLSLIVGAPGSGKTRILKSICDRVHASGKLVVWIEPPSLGTRASFPVVEINTMEDLAHLTASLLHPHKVKERADLIVLGDPQLLGVEDDGLAAKSKLFSAIFNRDLGSTAVAMSWQARRNTGEAFSTRSSQAPAGIGFQARVSLLVSKEGPLFNLKLSKSTVSLAGVSCTIDLTTPMDRSKIPTRYERILRGRN